MSADAPAPLATKAPVTDNLLFIDGISRSGKKLTCKVVSHLQNVEYFQYASVIENTAYAQHLGHLSLQTAARFIQVALDEVIYNRAIGRNLNARPSDETSVLKCPDYEAYVARMDAVDGAVAMDLFNREGRISAFHTHSVLAFIDILFAAFADFKFIHVTRHPIDIAEDQFRRGGGERWGVDPLIFSFTVETAGGPVPWFAIDWAESYHIMTPAERCIEAVIRQQARDRTRLKGLDTALRDRVFQFPFERLIEDTDATVESLAAFIGTSPDKEMKTLLRTENCSTRIPPGQRVESLKKLQAMSAADTIDRLLAASEIYEREWGLVVSA